MPYTIQMFENHPSVRSQPIEHYAACINAMHDCAEACFSCADACLSESDVQMLARCIRLGPVDIHLRARMVAAI